MIDDLSKIRAGLQDVLARHGLAATPLVPLPAKGVSHDHFLIGDSGWILRAARLSQLDLTAENQLAIQEAAFLRAAPSGATPKLLAAAPPSPGLERGGLIVEHIAGAAPRSTADLPALARALAAIHSLPPPDAAARPPIPDPANPLGALAARARAALEAYLPLTSLGDRAKAAIADRLDWLDSAVEEFSDLGGDALCVTDSHPGNFLIRPDGAACFVDLEKPSYGLPALDLAHTVIDVAAGWDPDAGMAPSAQDRDRFAKTWLDAVPPALAAANAPLIKPFRQAVWLRTISFFMRWQAESALQGPWSATRLGPEAAAHFRRHVSLSLSDAAVLAAADAWSD